MGWCPVHRSWGCDCRLAVALLCLALGACSSAGPRPAVCNEKDAALMVKEAKCLLEVGWMCRDVPAEEPCPYEDECKRVVRERCK